MRLLGKALTFDDVLLVPAFSQVLPKDTSLATRLSRNIPLNLPLVSAAMDTVTEARLAIAMAQEGGIGIVHKNLTAKQQAAEVSRVKRYESGVLRDPVVITPSHTVRAGLGAVRSSSGISGFPVVDGGKVVGIVTGRDLRFETRYDVPVTEIMTPREKLVTVRDGTKLGRCQGAAEQAQAGAAAGRQRRLRAEGPDHGQGHHQADQLPERGARRLRPAARGRRGRRRRGHRGARRGARQGRRRRHRGRHRARPQQGRARARALGQEELSAASTSSAATSPRRSAARALVEAGADAVKVGIGPGSICTTRIVAGVGVPQITAIDNVATALAGTGVPLIADGGVRYSGDIAKAIAAGASTVMMGGMFAGTEEAPGEIVLFQGRSYKSYRGMGSIGAMQQGSADRYFQEASTGNPNADKLVPEGIEGRVPYKGSLVTIVYQLAGGVRAAMGYCGCESIEDMRNQAEFVQITAAGMRESHVHDVQITKEAPNYRAD